MNFEAIREWFFGLGQNYGVNPLIFGAIYIGAIPFFSLSVAWLVRNFRQGKSIVLPVFSAVFCFISAYVYLILAGKNVPFWVYLIVVLLLVFGAYSTIKNIRRKIHTEKASDSDLKA